MNSHKLRLLLPISYGMHDIVPQVWLDPSFEETIFTQGQGLLLVINMVWNS